VFVSVSEIQFLTVEQWDLVMFFGDGFGGWFHATIVYLWPLIGWQKGIWPVKILSHFSQKGFFWKKMKQENQGELVEC